MKKFAVSKIPELLSRFPRINFTASLSEIVDTINTPMRIRNNIELAQQGIRVTKLNDVYEFLSMIADAYRHSQNSYAPEAHDLKSMINHIALNEWGVSLYRPGIEIPYSQTVWKHDRHGLSLHLWHIWDKAAAACRVHACFEQSPLHLSFSPSSRYICDKGDLKQLNPDSITEFEVLCVVDRERAEAVAEQWVDKLESRFPGAREIFEPRRLVTRGTTLKQYIVADDGLLVIARTWPYFLLGTPDGWFVIGDILRYVVPGYASICSLLQGHNIDYPESEEDRCWTPELALQIMLTFKSVRGYKGSDWLWQGLGLDIWHIQHQGTWMHQM